MIMNNAHKEVGLGYNLRRLRIQSGLTQEQVATQLKAKGSTITRSVYSRLETEELNIRVSDLMRLREIFHCGYEDFFTGITP